ncbi:MAG: hypothetical protein ACI9MF_002320 [Gammaproteobacteria bacterium]|jgi:hypothetical protein
MRLFCHFTLLLLLNSPFSFTSAQALNDPLVSLANHPIWLKLLHYEADGSTASGYLSAIHSPEFFISPHGRSDAYQELVATLVGLNAGTQETGNNHAQCRFPARYLWLQKQFPAGYFKLTPQPDCVNYSDWSLKGTTESLSVIFATGYLGNPASFYGHTLLKLNAVQTVTSTELEDTSINYGAIDIDDDNPVAYIFKGIFGGYDSGFSDMKYYFHDHNYGENELRDMWEYQLDLTADEVAFVVAHAWEVLGQKYTYHFFKQNCAYRMAELFGIIEGLDLVPDNPFWVFPQAVVQKLADARHQGRPLLKGLKKHLSRQSDLYHKYSSLSGNEQKVVADIADDIEVLQSQRFNALPTITKQRIVETLMDYYRVIRDRQALEDDPANLAYKKVLAMRFQLPPGKRISQEKSTQISPHEGRNPSLLSIGVTHKSKVSEQVQIRLRPAYYDTLDADEGHIDNAQLSMGDISFNLKDDDIELHYLDIIRIRSINSLATGLPGDTGFAWNMRAGWQQLDLSCSDCATFRFQGDVGFSKPLNRHLMLASYIGGGVQSVQQDYSHLFVRTSLVAQGELTGKLRYSMSVEARKYIGAGMQYHREFMLRYRLATNYDARISYRHDGSKEFGLSFGFYW